MRLFAFLLVALATGPAVAQRPPPPPAPVAAPPVPLLWVLADADSRVYLLGSIHILTEADYPLADVVEAAYANAEVLAFEVDLGTMEADAARLLPRYGLDPGGRSLADVLPDSLYRALGDVLRAHELSPALFDGLRPWAVALVVSELAAADGPLRTEWGVDRHLHDRAVADRRETTALETAESQFAALAGLPEAEQVAALAETLATLDAAPALLAATADLWRAGDAAGLARLVKEQAAEQPLAIKRLLGTRNRAWVAPIEALLARTGEDALVVVGAAHLVGPDSVVALLAARGHTVTRVEAAGEASPVGGADE